MAEKDHSSYGLNTLGPLCLWQCFSLTFLNFEKTNPLHFFEFDFNVQQPDLVQRSCQVASLAIVPLLVTRWGALALPYCLGMLYWHHKLVLSCYPHQPESRQLSLQMVCYWRTSRPRYWTPGASMLQKKKSPNNFFSGNICCLSRCNKYPVWVSAVPRQTFPPMFLERNKKASISCLFPQIFRAAIPGEEPRLMVT